MSTKMKGFFKGFKHISQLFGASAGRKKGKGPKGCKSNSDYNDANWMRMKLFIKENEGKVDCLILGEIVDYHLNQRNFGILYKEREMEIGYPTDVKHVAHIGWDGTSAAPPSWMNEFKTGPEFSAPSMRSLTQSRDLSSIPIDVQQSLGLPAGDDALQTEASEVRKKIKRKKNRETSPSSSRATRRRSKSKASFSTAADNQRGGMETQIAVI